MKSLKYITCVALTSLSMHAFCSSLDNKYELSAPLAVDAQKRVFSTLFDIELWSKTYPQKYDQDITIRIKFATRFDKSDVVEFLSEEAQEIHEFSDGKLKTIASSMNNSINCDPKADTILDFNYIPKKGIQVTCNDRTSNNLIPDGPESFYLLDVFLHPESEYSNLSNN